MMVNRYWSGIAHCSCTREVLASRRIPEVAGRLARPTDRWNSVTVFLFVAAIVRRSLWNKLRHHNKKYHRKSSSVLSPDGQSKVFFLSLSFLLFCILFSLVFFSASIQQTRGASHAAQNANHGPSCPWLALTNRRDTKPKERSATM